MNNHLVLVCILLCFLSLSVVQARVGESLRLVEYSENEREWITQGQLEKLTSRGVHLFDVTDHQNLVPKAWQLAWEPYIPSDCSQQPLVRSLNRNLNTQNLFDTISTLSSYHTRYYQSETGADAAEWIYSQYFNIIQNSFASSNPTVAFYNNTWKQPSIIARIPGDPNSPYAEEIVILGGHIDSIIVSNFSEISRGICVNRY